jgi:hypothetical protein
VNRCEALDIDRQHPSKLSMIDPTTGKVLWSITKDRFFTVEDAKACDGKELNSRTVVANLRWPKPAEG